MELVLKTSGRKRLVGSNPTPSALDPRAASVPGSVGPERVSGLREKGDQRLVPLSAERGANPLL